MKVEEWRPIIGYKGSYEVSDYGRVKSLDRYIQIQAYSGGNQYQKQFNSSAKTVFRKGRVLKPKDYKGYKSVDLSGKPCKVHRLVAQAFIPNPKNKPNINHIDNNPSNNNSSNLEWCTQKENMQHAVKQNRMINGERISTSKLSEDDVRKIRNSFLPTRELVKIYNVHRRHILRIKRSIQWKHIT